MSADRAFTDSEVSFLTYIRQWSKKVVFVLNKVDLLEDEEQTGQMLQFVRENAQRTVGIESATVIPVSARKALQAKLGQGGRATASVDLEALGSDPRWSESQFESLERFLVSFLSSGGEGQAGELFRLKLTTPLAVAEALLDAGGRLVRSELDSAEKQLESIRAVGRQVQGFRREMERDGEAQRGRIRKAVTGAVERAERVLDSLVQLSNFASLSKYLLGSSDACRMPVATALDPKGELVGSLASQVQELVQEHGTWLDDNTARQLEGYRGFAERQADALGAQAPPRTAADAASDGSGGPALSSSSSLAEVQSRFGELLRVKQLEEEVREIVLSTAGFLGGALVALLLLTSIFDNALEDILVLALSGLAAYVGKCERRVSDTGASYVGEMRGPPSHAGVVNLPLRRAEVKGKLRSRADKYAEELETLLASELGQGLARVETTIEVPSLFGAQPAQARVADLFLMP